MKYETSFLSRLFIIITVAALTSSCTDHPGELSNTLYLRNNTDSDVVVSYKNSSVSIAYGNIKELCTIEFFSDLQTMFGDTVFFEYGNDGRFYNATSFTDSHATYDPDTNNILNPSSWETAWTNESNAIRVFCIRLPKT